MKSRISPIQEEPIWRRGGEHRSGPDERRSSSRSSERRLSSGSSRCLSGMGQGPLSLAGALRKQSANPRPNWRRPSMELNKLFTNSSENVLEEGEKRRNSFGEVMERLPSFTRRRSSAAERSASIARRRGSAEERSAGLAIVRASKGVMRRASLEIKGLDTFISTERRKRKKQLFEARRQTEQRYEEMVARLLIRARTGWAKDRGVSKSHGISIVDKRNPEDDSGQHARDDKSDATSTTITTIARGASKTGGKMTIQAQRRSNALAPELEASSQLSTRSETAAAWSVAENQSRLPEWIRMCSTTEARDTVLRMLLKTDSYVRCGLYACQAAAVWYVLVAIPYEIGWPELMHDLVPLRELCRALFTVDLLMTGIQRSFELSDVDADDSKSTSKLDSRIWLLLDAVAVLPYEAFVHDRAWRNITHLAFLIKVALLHPFSAPTSEAPAPNWACVADKRPFDVAGEQAGLLLACRAGPHAHHQFNEQRGEAFRFGCHCQLSGCVSNCVSHARCVAQCQVVLSIL